MKNIIIDTESRLRAIIDTAVDRIITTLKKEMELNGLKSRFVTMASHEFRTLLSAILSSVFLISKYNDPKDEEKRTKHINRIKSSVIWTLSDFKEEGLIDSSGSTITIVNEMKLKNMRN
jgi:signal transduction histidine kinase